MDDDGIVYFSWLKSFNSANHDACVWQLIDSGPPKPLFVVDDRSGTVQSSNVWIELGLDGHLYGSERIYLGEHAGHDNFASTVWRINEDGTQTPLVGPKAGSAPFGNGAFAVDRDGALIYAHDRRMILKRYPDERPIVVAGGSRGFADGLGANARFESITSLAWGPDGALYASDRGSIRIVGNNGSVVTLASEPPDETPALLNQRGLFDIAVDANGNVFGADWGRRRVVKITREGEYSVVYECSPPWTPEGIAVRREELYVLESTFPESTLIRPRIRKRSPDGSFSTLFEVPK